MQDLNAWAALDAQLIDACLAFDTLEKRVDAFNDPNDPAYIENDDDRDAAIAPIEAEQAPLMERICVLNAMTLDGARARIHSFLLWNKAINPIVDAAAPNRPWNERMIAAALRDLERSALREHCFY